MARRKLRILWNYFGRRYKQLVLMVTFLVSASLLAQAWWVSRAASALLPPPPQGQDLRHYRRDRNLKRYLDSIQLLIEPSSSQPLCEGADEVPLLVLVSSAPSHLDSRQAIRQTWAQHLPTFFVLGLDGPEVDEQLKESEYTVEPRKLFVSLSHFRVKRLGFRDTRSNLVSCLWLRKEDRSRSYSIVFVPVYYGNYGNMESRAQNNINLLACSESHDAQVDIYIEAKQYGDMVVYDFVDHYQNLTLKSVLMLQWSQQRCPQAEALFKTDDDVFVNPWMLRVVVKEHINHQLIGYKINNTVVHRDEYTKWYLPRWLYPEESISEYLSGTGYIINGEYIERILKAAHSTPIINLEDVYLTHIVAKSLHLTLSHDRRLSPFKPWIRFGCSFWDLASVHSLNPDEIVYAWSKILPLVKHFEKERDVCSFFGFLSSDLFLY